MSQAGTVIPNEAAETTALVCAIVSWIYTVIIVIIAVLQTVKVSDDLLKNTYTANYKLIQTGTCIIIYFCFLSVIAGDLLYSSSNDTECATRFTLILNFQQFSKTMTFLVLLQRLLTYYKGTQFAIAEKKLFKFGIAAVVIGVVSLFLIVLFPVKTTRIYFNGYPSWCVISKEFNLFYVAGVIVIGQDIAAAASFIYLFHVRWKQIEEMVTKKEDDPQDVATIIYYVSKIRILATTMLILTVLLTLITMITGLGVFAQADLVVVPICLILMTPYYPDKVYYAKLCGICHCACGGKGKPAEEGVGVLFLKKFAKTADGANVEQPHVQMLPQQTQQTEQTSTL